MIMKKLDVLRSISKNFNISLDDQELFTKFLNENNELNDHDFFEKFKIEFPWVDYTYKSQNILRQKRIDNHLLFFKVLTIISLVIGFLSVIVNWFNTF